MRPIEPTPRKETAFEKEDLYELTSVSPALVHPAARPSYATQSPVPDRHTFTPTSSFMTSSIKDGGEEVPVSRTDTMTPFMTGSDPVKIDMHAPSASVAPTPGANRPKTDQLPGITQDDGRISWRAIAIGVVLGALLNFSNMYFGLQTGWVTMGSLQSSLLAFGFFRAFSHTTWMRRSPFTAHENVLAQTTAVATATMPLAAGFTGIIPAITILLKPSEGGPIALSPLQLLLWTLAVAFFGVFFAIPLRKQTIIKEKLPFPSGTATAMLIHLLHRVPGSANPSPNPPIALAEEETPHHRLSPYTEEAPSLPLGATTSSSPSLTATTSPPKLGTLAMHKLEPVTPHLDDLQTPFPLLSEEDGLRGRQTYHPSEEGFEPQTPLDRQGSIQHHSGEGELSQEDAIGLASGDMRSKFLHLFYAFCASAGYSFFAHFLPVLSALPIGSWVGLDALTQWYWYITPSLSYAGQGMIMGHRAALSMLAGAIFGWGIVGPIAKAKGWAPGHISAQSDGAKGWILWLSLAIMLAESVSSCILLSGRAFYRLYEKHHEKVAALLPFLHSPRARFSPTSRQAEEVDIDPAPLSQRVSPKVTYIGLIASTILCVAIVGPMFKIGWYIILSSVLFACLVSIMAVRTLGEIDLNPVSGIGKISQLVFAAVSPGNIVANILAGAIAEAGAQQAGDMMQDLKTGHLIGSSPRTQFVGQVIGSVCSVAITVGAYQLYNSAYTIGEQPLSAPTAEIWITMARIVTGGQLPDMVQPFAIGLGVIFFLIPMFKEWKDFEQRRHRYLRHDRTSLRARLLGLANRCDVYIPSGVAFAIGMFVTPNYTLPRVAGGLIGWVWKQKYPASFQSGSMVIWASGFVLGEGIMSVITSIFRVIGWNAWTCWGLTSSQHNLC